MNITIKTLHHADISPASLEALRHKFEAIGRLLGADAETALLDIEVERAPAEGRSADPYRLVANLEASGAVYHGEAVKPSPESAGDRVRSQLEAEIRRVRGKEKRLWKRGRETLKELFRG